MFQGIGKGNLQAKYPPVENHQVRHQTRGVKIDKLKGKARFTLERYQGTCRLGIGFNLGMMHRF
jgi:hypothetical protein